MAKMLVFGGPNLPAGTLTWFQRLDPATGLVHEVIQVRPGDSVPVEFVGLATIEAYVDSNGEPASPPIATVRMADGKTVLRPGFYRIGEHGVANADYYVQTGRASYADAPEAVHKD